MTKLDPEVAAFILAIWISANIIGAGVWDVACVWMGDNEDCFISTHLARWAHEFPVGVLMAGIFLGHILWSLRQNGK